MDFLGSGWGFPIASDGRGFRVSREDENIEENIWLILYTVPGTRLMRPEFGCRIHELIFAGVDATSASLAVEYVRSALLRFEPRITDLEVAVEARVADAMLEIQVAYLVIATNTRRNLVYPFYLEGPG